MSKNSVTKRSYCFVIICLILFLLSNMAYAEIIGTYEVGDFSSYNRNLVLGTDIDAGDIISINGFNALQLSGDNEFVRTAGDLAGFTYGSDWSWMTIMRADQVENFRVFMRGFGWQDKVGDFDLRLYAGNDSMYSWTYPKWTTTSATDSAISNTDLVWLAGTYDYSAQIYSLYINGTKINENTISTNN
ncbi:MAG: hypothetical protein PVG39_26445, partial [Desulfobacteraceae bacterium]